MVGLIPMSELQDNMTDFRFLMITGSILSLLAMLAFCLSVNLVDQYILITLSVAWMSRQLIMWFSEAMISNMFIWDVLFHTLLVLILGIVIQILTNFDKKKSKKDLILHEEKPVEVFASVNTPN